MMRISGRKVEDAGTVEGIDHSLDVLFKSARASVSCLEVRENERKSHFRRRPSDDLFFLSQMVAKDCIYKKRDL